MCSQPDAIAPGIGLPFTVALSREFESAYTTRRTPSHWTENCNVEMGTYMKLIVFAVTLGAFGSTLALGQERSLNNTDPGIGTQAPSNKELRFGGYIELLRTDVDKEKSRIIGDAMQLDADQAAAFWPIYRDFQNESDKIVDLITGAVADYIANYETMTNAEADQLATKVLDIDQQRNDLKRKYYGKFKTALDSVTAARFLQVENQIDRLIDFQISAHLPLIGEQAKLRDSNLSIPHPSQQ